MALVNICNRQVEVDIRAELEQYEWTRAKWSHEKLLAASPFRYDNHPSFYVYLDDTANAPAGSFGDSGAIDSEYAKGGFVKLLAFLRNEDESSTAEYLFESYATDFTYNDDITLNLSQYSERPTHIPPDSRIVEDYRYRHPYLESRGIGEKVQRIMNVGYDKKRQSVTIPWYYADGRLANVKYRRVDSKVFWYEKGAVPVRDLVYGINIAYKFDKKVAVLCEAEIDAMSVMEIGYCGLAVGGSSFNTTKRDIIAKSPVETLIIATDNDDAGEKLKRKVIEMMTGYCELRVVDWNKVNGITKDVNEVLSKNNKSLREFVEKSERVETLLNLGFT